MVLLERICSNIKTFDLCWSIDLFTNMAAILNLLDLRSIMGCPGGSRSVSVHNFCTKRELYCIFLGKKAIIITSKHGTAIFFSHYNLFLRKLTEKLARKASVNTERVYWIVVMPPGHPIILLKFNECNMAKVSVKNVYSFTFMTCMFDQALPLLGGNWMLHPYWGLKG